MKVICTRCGSAEVTCEAWINPNEAETKEALDHFSDDSFNYGYCPACDRFAGLTDVDETRKDIEEKYLAYKEQSGQEPNAARCEITYRSSGNGTEEVLIKIACDGNGNKNYFPFCEDIVELKALCDRTDKNFIVTEVYCFE
ncbi:hypothetical protein IR083_18250 [Dysgonomonas sp. GY75]|uniref:hypothetical protein n=1 Tax=Dysgonomonas sp. GY75 TaxID=2780419 RepID=UPI0018834037|nr:hypothetical protein [Dysgonomonas sp. GY75]MBF0650767.1 hypothetical protein [Dysgonomonas sp. GY75]